MITSFSWSLNPDREGVGKEGGENKLEIVKLRTQSLTFSRHKLST